MTRDELLEILQGHEWTDVEFKEAARAVPKDVWETVSAFSNTAGGHLVFGVRDTNGVHQIVGVVDVDKVQNDFLSTVRSGQKVNRPISVIESQIRDGDATLLVFYIPEARRQDKPVYINGDMKQTFIRRGACDERCRREEIESFVREALDERHDSVAIDTDVETFFDVESLKWYRAIYNEKHPGNETIALNDVEFLHHWGLVVEQNSRLVPTRGAVLLFGHGSIVRQHLPRAVVDCQWISSKWDDAPADDRWSDRVLVEENLIRAWRVLVRKFMDRAQHPFSLDPATLRREESPPDYLAFRESVINLLIHQDYADHGRKATIQFFRDRLVLHNPGDSFANPDDLLEPGAKQLRNPRIVAALRRIGLNEEAGTGFRVICRSWERLGHVPPIVENDKGRKSFTLHLVREQLLSEQQLLFQASLGVRLSTNEARAFAFACRNRNLRLRDVKAIAGVSAGEAQNVIDRLLTQVLVAEVVPGNRSHVILSDHLRDRIPFGIEGASLSRNPQTRSPRNLVSDQPAGVGASLVSDQPAGVGAGLVSDQPAGIGGDLVSDQPAGIGGDLVSDQPAGIGGDLVSDHPAGPHLISAQPIASLTPLQREIVRMCDVYRTLADLMEKAGVTHRHFFKKTHLNPLIRAGVLQMQYPEQPNHPQQAYVLTSSGVAIAQLMVAENTTEGAN